MQLCDEHFFIIPGFSPSNRQWGVNDRPGIRSRFLCNYVWVSVPEQQNPEMLFLIDFVPGGVEILRLEEHGGKTGIKLNLTYPPRLLALIHGRRPSNS